MPDDAPSENAGDLNAMFDEINNLPADDPLRVASAGRLLPSTRCRRRHCR